MNPIAAGPAVAILHWVCAVGYAGFATLILIQARRSWTGVMLSGAALATALWAAAIAFTMPDTPLMVVDCFDLLRSLAWYGFVLHLYRRAAGAQASRRVFATMGLIGLLMVGLLGLTVVDAQSGNQALVLAAVLSRLGVGVCGLLLLENLWRNAAQELRWHINLACVALGALFVYDIVLSADIVLTRRISPALFAGHALTSILALPLLVLTAARNRTWRVDIHVSRAAAFHSATLIVSGLFLLSLALAGEVFRGLATDESGGTWADVAELGLIFAGVLGAGVLVTSGSARSWIRATVVDHFFSHRYDYRREWIRCIATLSAPDTYVPLHVRAIRALAEIVDSPAGALYLADAADMPLQWAGSWNMDAPTVPLLPDHPLVSALLECGTASDGIVLMSRWRGQPLEPTPLAQAWLAVSLGEQAGFMGMIVLAHPRADFQLDREVHDMLRTVARMVTSFVAEQRLTETLTQTRQLHEYGKRFAFVAHDIKNVSSQLSLLLSNAETHIQNPDFQRDMLGTVRASVQKITTLLRRLQEPEQDLASTVTAPGRRLAALIAACEQGRPLRIVLDDDGLTGSLPMSAAAFDAALTHLLNNAADASSPGSTVRVRLRREVRGGVIDITDSGSGMSPEFVRDELFRPFATSKQGGTGIGVFQARELVRQSGGELVALSKVGAGTTMRLVLPMAPLASGQPVALRSA